MSFSCSSGQISSFNWSKKVPSHGLYWAQAAGNFVLDNIHGGIAVANGCEVEKGLRYMAQNSYCNGYVCRQNWLGYSGTVLTERLGAVSGQDRDKMTDWPTMVFLIFLSIRRPMSSHFGIDYRIVRRARRAL